MSVSSCWNLVCFDHMSSDQVQYHKHYTIMCVGTAAGDASIWLSSNPAHPGALHRRPGVWNPRWTPPADGAPRPWPVRQLRRAACVGARSAGRQEQDHQPAAWKVHGAQSAQVCQVRRLAFSLMWWFYTLLGLHAVQPCSLLLPMLCLAWSVCWWRGWAIQKRLNCLRCWHTIRLGADSTLFQGTLY